MKKRIFWQKVLTFITAFALITQSFSPYIAILSQPSYAQTVTETPTPTPTQNQTTVTPTPSQNQTTPTPTPDSTTPTPTITPTPTDTANVTPTVTPTDTLTPTPTPDGLSPPNTATPTPTISNLSNPTDSPTPTVNPSQTPTPTPTTTPNLNENLNAVIVHNVKANTLDLSTVTSAGSATLTTNKADYSPTDSVVISGTGFLPKTTYTLEIVSQNPPPVDFTTSVTTDNKGELVYAYQLDGNYRPNYTVYAKDSSGTVVATTSFTDSGVTVNVLSWNIIGVDSNDPATAGPHQFVIQARVTNNTGADISNVSADFALGSRTSYISTYGPTTQNIGTISNGNSADVFFQVTITPPSSPNTSQNPVFGTTKNYTITANYTDGSGTQTATYDNTLTVQDLISQNRNSIVSTVISPSTITLGSTFTVTVTSKTTGGGNFDNVSVPMMFDPTVAQMTGVTTTYQIPSGTSQNSFYDQNVGGDIQSVFTFKAIGTGTSNFYWLIYDQSGGSYHYNSDFGNAIVITIQPQFSITKTPATQTVNPGATASFSSTISNSGNGSGVISSIVDTLPTGFSYVSGSTTGDITTNPTINGQELTWTGTWTIDAGKSITFNYQATASTTPGTYTNSIEAYDNNNNAIGPATAQIIVPAYGSITVVKDANPTGSQSFGFTTTGTGLSSFSLTDDGTNPNSTTFNNLSAGDYSISETPTTGWTLSGVSCLDNSTQKSVSTPSGTGTGTISLTAGQNVTCTFTNTKLGRITVTKNTTPAQVGTFPFESTSPQGSTLPSTFSITTNSNGTGSNIYNDLSSGAYTITELTPTSWVPGTIECTDDNNAAAGNIATVNNATVSFNLGVGQDVTCTYNNTAKGTLIIKKTTVGGTGTFTFNVPGVSPSPSITTTSPNVAVSSSPITVTEGTYDITENLPDNTWKQTDASCDNGDNPSSVTVGLDQTVTCSFTNTKLATVKIVKNALGGNGTFNFNSTGGLNPSTFSIDTSVNSTQEFDNVTPGQSYTVSEPTQPNGWSLSNISCSSDNRNSTTSTNLSNQTATISDLGAGDTVTCTFTDTLLPTLTVIKDVNNNYGGTAVASDFEIHVLDSTSTDVTNSPQPGSKTGTTYTLDPGTYTVSEDDPTPLGYSQTSISCDNQNTSSVTLVAGQNSTCTITNSDIQPKLIVIKHVVNTNGGTLSASDFTMNVSGSNVSDPSFPGVESPGTTVTLNAGAYSVTEDPVIGYSGSLSTDCSGSISVGQTKTCTITNSDKPGTLIVKKVIKNDNGGTGTYSDFSFKVNGGSSITFNSNGENDLTVNAGTYSVTENPASGYSTTYNNCSNVIVPNGGTATCTITNDDIAPSLSLVKVVNNPYGGTEKPSAWTLTATGPSTISGAGGVSSDSTFQAGTYSLSESGPSGYSASSWSCILNNGSPVTGSSIKLTNGDTATCTITNTAEPGHLIVNKVTDPSSDTTTKFSITAAGTGTVVDPTQDITGGTSVNYTVDAGTYSVTETSVSGWDETRNDCNDISVSNGETKSCTITNTERGSITLTKFTDPSGSPQGFDFTLTGLATGSATANGITDGNSYTFNDLLPNTTYGLSETSVNGWDLTYTQCIDQNENIINGAPNSITLSPGENVFCEFDNTERGNIIVTKYNDVNGTGIYNPSNPTLSGWTINLASTSGGMSQTTDSNGEAIFSNIAPYTSYTVSENQQSGWTQTDISCTNPNIEEEIPMLNVNLNNTANVYPGQTTYCYILNHNLIPVLTITKQNFASGVQSPGNSVKFEITITATQSAAENVTVTDLLPDGFHFDSGSWKVVSSDTSRGTNGDITSSLTAPTYHSPGTWTLGNLADNETLTLTYAATIDNSQASGTYYDNAWGQGYSSSGVQVLANATDPGNLNSSDPTNNFVGTQVAVANSYAPGVTYNATNNVTQEVLGASTYLPATGEPTVWVIIATLLSLLGIGSILAGFKLRNKYEK